MDDTIARLAARAGAGDERAFAELVERHREPLLRYVARRFRPSSPRTPCRRRCCPRTARCSAGRVPADVRAWLSTIAWRRALDLARRERDALPLDAASPAAPAQRARGARDPGQRARPGRGRVLRAARAPARRRCALSALEGRSLEEIGDALDVAPDTAKSLVARSRRTLTHRLAAAELDCGDGARCEMEAAAARGVRLGGAVTLHLQRCRACARAHRAIRRAGASRCAAPVRAARSARAGLRDQHPRPDRLQPRVGGADGAAKLCTAACLTAVGAGDRGRADGDRRGCRNAHAGSRQVGQARRRSRGPRAEGRARSRRRRRRRRRRGDPGLTMPTAAAARRPWQRRLPRRRPPAIRRGDRSTRRDAAGGERRLDDAGVTPAPKDGRQARL